MLQQILALLTNTTVSVAVIGMVGWLVRSIISQSLSQQLEKHKASLQRDAIEHRVRFTRMHDRTLDTIVDVYALLRDFAAEGKSYVSKLSMDPRPLEERRDALEKSITAFLNYYWPRRILLPKELADQIEKFANRVMAALQIYHRANLAAEKNADPSKLIELAKEVEKIANEEMPQLFEELEIRFRSFVGSYLPPGGSPD